MKHKYEIKDYQYINLGYDDKTDGAEIIINFLYQVIVADILPEKVKFPSKNLHRAKLLWLLHNFWDMEHGKQK
jgi:hypothetical protein